MKNAAGWIFATLALIAAFTGLVLIYGGLGFIAGCALIVIFLFGLDRVQRWRSSRLVRSLTQGETLAASGIVSESTYDETPAILVRIEQDRYRVHIADSRGSQVVLALGPELTRHSNAYDLKLYLEMVTAQGLVHFAPRKGMSAAAQPDHAQEVMADMLAHGVPLER